MMLSDAIMYLEEGQQAGAREDNNVPKTNGRKFRLLRSPKGPCLLCTDDGKRRELRRS
jgi:hypothetical protein